MADQQRYRILMPDNRLSHDTFAVASEQPSRIKAGCVLVANDRDGKHLTAHRSRLFLTADAERPNRACLKCGHVHGVVEDEVKCPHHGGDLCGLIEPHDRSALAVADVQCSA